MLPPDIPWLFPSLQSGVYSVSPPQNGLPWTPPPNQSPYHFQSPYSTYFSIWHLPQRNSFLLICLIVYDPSPQPEFKFCKDQDFSSFFLTAIIPIALRRHGLGVQYIGLNEWSQWFQVSSPSCWNPKPPTPKSKWYPGKITMFQIWSGQKEQRVSPPFSCPHATL